MTNTQNDTDPNLLNFDCREIPERRPVLIRHDLSGVWIGWIKGVGILPHILVLEGRRIYSWHGERLETSQIAKKGVSNKDRLCEWETVQIPCGAGDGLVEIHGTSDKLVEEAKALPSTPV